MKCGGTKNIIKIDIVGKLENVVLFHTYIIWRKIMYNEEKIEVEVLPANEGECILVTIEKEDIHILIDGGTSETYRRFLKSRLVQLKKAGKNIDLLIVTHIDNDHIGGILVCDDRWINSYNNLNECSIYSTTDIVELLHEQKIISDEKYINIITQMFNEAYT